MTRMVWVFMVWSRAKHVQVAGLVPRRRIPWCSA
jgi:hypothetical protein